MPPHTSSSLEALFSCLAVLHGQTRNLVDIAHELVQGGKYFQCNFETVEEAPATVSDSFSFVLLLQWPHETPYQGDRSTNVSTTSSQIYAC